MNTYASPPLVDRLFFDGQCPLCRLEMKQLATLHDDRLELVDIHSYQPEPGQPNSAQMLKILHLQKADGSWLKGLDANVAAWQHTRWGWAFRVLRWPLVRALADRIYLAWAEKRFARRYACGNYCMGGEEGL